MKLYHYSPTDFTYTGSTEARPDPKRAGRFLVPANATETPPPPHGDLEVAVMVEGNWVVSEDFRGYWYNKDNGAAFVCESPLDAPDNATREAPPKLQQGQLVRWSNAAWEVYPDGFDYVRWFDAELAKGFTTGSNITLGLYQEDVSLLTGNFVLAKEAASLGMPIPPLIDTDGVPHPIESIEELTTIMLSYGQHRAELSAEYARRKSEV